MNNSKPALSFEKRLDEYVDLVYESEQAVILRIALIKEYSEMEDTIVNLVLERDALLKKLENCKK